MDLILNIDTAGKLGMVSLSQNGKVLHSIGNNNPMEHGAFLQPAIGELFQQAGLNMQQLQAVSVSNGPGSYTGLRVGLASAKGLCYALQIPLITLSTLKIMAFAASILVQNQPETGYLNGREIYCPMVDARRMEVFYGIYLSDMKTIKEPEPMVLDAGFMQEALNNGPIVFSGNGAAKWQALTSHPNALFTGEPPTELAMAILSHNAFQRTAFADIVRSEPFYCKAFYEAARPGV